MRPHQFVTYAAIALCWLTQCAPAGEQPRAVALPASSSAPPRAASVAEQRAVAAPSAPPQRVILFVWDGLRPDAVNEVDTPHLNALAQRGVRFEDHHSVYPTVTMVNASVFATGAYPTHSGFLGNVVYAPGATGNDSHGKPVPFGAPVFVEDDAVLDALAKQRGGHLFQRDTLFELAQRRGLRTAAIGKSAAAYLQDAGRAGVIVDERLVAPKELALELLDRGIALPDTNALFYPNEPRLANAHGDPTAAFTKYRLADGVTGDPDDTHGAPFTLANEYLLKVFLDVVLPTHKPELTVLWLRDPDSTEHVYGPGTSNYQEALRAMDRNLGLLEQRLETLGLSATTNLIVVSDHGHSTISGPPSRFPLRKANAEREAAGALDPSGHSVSGDVRLASVLSQAGLLAFDGAGCAYSPSLAGIEASGRVLHPTRIDKTGKICGHVGDKYTSPSFELRSPLPSNAVVVAVNGGSDYLYLPSHDPELAKHVVRELQKHEELALIFASDRYPKITGTLPLSAVGLDLPDGPDLIVGYAFDEQAVVSGVAGIEYAGSTGGVNRGTHGSFSRRDVHNFLAASGPAFRTASVDSLPSANVDVAPTLARILGLEMPSSDGRPLLEALQGGPAAQDFSVQTDSLPLAAAPASGAPASSYTPVLKRKSLTYAGATFRYFDSGFVERARAKP